VVEFKPFKPFDGAEALKFEKVFCENCARHNRTRICPLLAAAALNDPVDPGFPEEWRFGDKGPECTACEPGLRRVG
jgi:hypothetical protein